MTRSEILQLAEKLTTDDRNRTYGEPKDNLAATQALIEVYLAWRCVRYKHTPAHDAAIILALAKIGRIATGEPHRDNYVDAAAYLAIAGELSNAV